VIVRPLGLAVLAAIAFVGIAPRYETRQIRGAPKYPSDIQPDFPLFVRPPSRTGQ